MHTPCKTVGPCELDVYRRVCLFFKERFSNLSICKVQGDLTTREKPQISYERVGGFWASYFKLL